MYNTRKEIDNYLELWDQAQKFFPKEKEKKKKNTAPSSNSFFGMSNVPEDDFTEDEEEHWRDIYYRSLEIDPDEISGAGGEDMLNEDEIDQQCLAGMMDIREAKEAKKKAAEAKFKKKTNKNNSKKKDIESDVRKPKGGKTPKLDKEHDGFGKHMARKLGDVEFSPNPIHFASVGDDAKLRVTPNFTDGDELRELSRLKSLLYDLETELLGTDVRGGNPEPLRVKMIAVRRQCEALSQKLIPDPRTDVS